MNWANFLFVLAALSLIPAMALILALSFESSRYFDKVFIYCLVSCVVGGVIWVSIGVGLGLTALVGGSNG